MSWTPKTALGKGIVATAVIAGSLVTIAGAYKTFSFLPVPAWASDIQRLERQQLKFAIPDMEDRLDRFILRRGQINQLPNNEYFEREKQSLDRQIDRLKDDIGTALDRRKELVK